LVRHLPELGKPLPIVDDEKFFRELYGAVGLMI
jgi:hypothetical protein